MRKAFNTSIDTEILQKFKDKCKEESLPINIVLERFMQGYVEQQKWDDMLKRISIKDIRSVKRRN